MLKSKLLCPIKVSIHPDDNIGKKMYIKVRDKNCNYDIHGHFNKKGFLNGKADILINNAIYIINGTNEFFYQSFHGNFVNGLLHGHGKTILINIDKQKSILNSSFEGNWTNGYADGKAIIFKDSVKVLIGKWDMGVYCFNKKSSVKYNDGAHYIGFFKDGFPFGAGVYKNNYYKKIQGIFYKWYVYDKNCILIYNNKVEYKGGYLKNKKHGYGVENIFNKICNCCNKPYLEKHNLLNVKGYELERIKSKTKISGYWKDGKLAFKSKELKTCMKCNKEPQICCIKCKNVFCEVHYKETHFTQKTKSHEIIKLNFDRDLELLKLDDMENKLNNIKNRLNRLNKITKLYISNESEKGESDEEESNEEESDEEESDEEESDEEESKKWKLEIKKTNTNFPKLTSNDLSEILPNTNDFMSILNDIKSENGGNNLKFTNT